ncbi:MAG: eL32 family ribosomal protein [Candidatus Parvarchaeum sp.]
MEFTKHDARKLKRVGNSWRKPTGKKNKTKVGKKGHKKMPSKGFRSPVSKRGRIAGRIPVRVFNVSDVEKLNDSNIAVIGKAVGALKRKLIYEKCKEKKIMVINYAGETENAKKDSQ